MPFSKDEEATIAAFRGTPVDRSQMRLRNGRVELGSALEVLIEKHHIGKASPTQILLDNWPRIVGDANARHCAPGPITRGHALVILCAHPARRRELMFWEDRIMTALRTIPELAHIRRLVFRAG